MPGGAPTAFGRLNTLASQPGVVAFAVVVCFNVFLLYRMAMLEGAVHEQRQVCRDKVDRGHAIIAGGTHAARRAGELQSKLQAGLDPIGGGPDRGGQRQRRRGPPTPPAAPQYPGVTLPYSVFSNLSATMPPGQACELQNANKACDTRAEGPVFISVTTTPKRLHSKIFGRRIKTLLQQRYPVAAVLIAVPHISAKTGLPYPAIPEALLQSATETKVIVVRGKDYGPASKLLLPLGYLASSPACRDASLIIADDDVFYHEELACAYVQASLQYPNAALTVRGKAIRNACRPFYNETINYTHDRLWMELPLDENFTKPTPVEIMTGVGTFLVKPRYFDQAVFDYDACDVATYAKSFLTDDIWISGHLARRGVQCISIPLPQFRPGPYNAFPRPVDGLWQLYNQGTSNNDVIMRVFQRDFGCREPSPPPQQGDPVCTFEASPPALLALDRYVVPARDAGPPPPAESTAAAARRPGRKFLVIASDTSADLDGEVQGEFIWICNLARMLLSDPANTVHFFPVYKRLGHNTARMSLFPDDPRLRIILPQSRSPADLFEGYSGSLDFHRANPRGHVLFQNGEFLNLLAHLSAHNDYAVILVRHSSYSVYTRDLMLRHPDMLRKFWFMTHRRTDDFPVAELHKYGASVMFQSELMFPTGAFRPVLDGVHRRELWVPPMVAAADVVAAPRRGPPEGRLRVCYVGAYNYDGKDTYLINAMISGFSKLRERISHATLLVVLSGLDRMAAQTRGLLASFPGLEVRGAVSHDEAIQIYTTECDFGVRGLMTDPDRPDKSLMVATKIVEMSSLGVPIILNPSAINRHLLPADYPLFWDEEAPAESFAAVVEKAYAEPELYRRASRQVWGMVTNFTFQATYARLLPAIQQTARWASVARDVASARFSVLVPLEKRYSDGEVLEIVQRFTRSPYVHAVYLVWTRKRSDADALFKKLYANKLSHLTIFLFTEAGKPISPSSILTKAVFIAHEDLLVEPDALESGFWTWQDNKKVLVGFQGGRCARFEGREVFVPEANCRESRQCNVVLVQSTFLDKAYLAGVANWNSGIGLNFVVAARTGSPSVAIPYSRAKEAYFASRCEGCSKLCRTGLEEHGEKLKPLSFSVEYFLDEPDDVQPDQEQRRLRRL